MPSSRTTALVDHLSQYRHLVEVGIGNRTAIAAGLVERGCSVVATDIVDRSVPDGIQFVRDDITEPDLSIYQDADLLYALRCPPELHRPLCRVGAQVDVPVRFTTLGTDPPAVPVEPLSLPGTTLYRPRDRTNFSSHHL